jgi:arylsulfatase A-like enzyme
LKILFILQDALRRDHLGCYGYPKNTTPNIDRLAKEGVRFDSVVAASTHTFPSIISIITGQWTATHGLMSAQDYALWKHQRHGGGTPLRILQEQDFMVDGELVTRWKPLGFSRDTEDVEAYFEENTNGRWFFLAEPYSTHLPYNPPQEYYEMFVDANFRPSEPTLKKLEIVRTRMIIHPPGLKSAFEIGQGDAIGQGDEIHRRSAGAASFDLEDRPGVIALYDGEVRVFDDLVGRWITKLENLNLLDDTLVIITADHGEELLERGHLGHSSCNLKGTLFDECLMVPLILRYPPKLPSGKVAKNQVSQVDIMPSIFDLLGLTLQSGMDGCSFLPLIYGRAGQFREESYSETTPAGWQALLGDERRIWSIRTSDWKLILHTDVSADKRHYELYNLCTDPGETINCFEKETTKANQLKAKLDAYVLKASIHKSWKPV